MKNQLNYIVRIATSDDHKYTTEITDELAYSATKRGISIARRTPEYAINKMDKGLAVIALNPENGDWIGFCCIEVWEHQKYVASSGLIISPKYRGMGIATMLKARLFELCQTKFPKAKIFSLTTNQAVIHANIDLGFKIVAFSEVLNDSLFMDGCKSWVDFSGLMNNNPTHAYYVAMVFDPTYSTILINKWQYFTRKIKTVGRKEVAIQV